MQVGVRGIISRVVPPCTEQQTKYGEHCADASRPDAAYVGRAEYRFCASVKEQHDAGQEHDGERPKGDEIVEILARLQVYAVSVRVNGEAVFHQDMCHGYDEENEEGHEVAHKSHRAARTDIVVVNIVDDVKYAEDNGITVKNTPRASSNSVAELALAHMLSCSRYISIAGHTMREDKWEKKAYGKGIEIEGKTLGIIGFGRIGQALGRKAKALGMTVIAEDIYHVPGIEEEMGIKYVELDELLSRADYISLHTPSLNGVKLIRKENIDKMKDGVVFINTSRGDNVDEADLLEALNSGKIRAAGLDVYADEPATNKALYSHPNVSCTPHIGAATKEAQQRIGMEIVDIIENFGK